MLYNMCKVKRFVLTILKEDYYYYYYALQLKAAQVRSRFNYDTMPSLKSLNLSIAAS